MLNVMPQLVSQHVCLREIAGRPESALQFVVETEIDVDLLIQRTVERSHRRLRGSTAGLRRVAEEDEFRVLIRNVSVAKDRTPRVLYIVEHERHKLDEPIL